MDRKNNRRAAKNGTRSPGRQEEMWRDDIAQMKGVTWGRDAGQRDGWRRDAEEATSCSGWTEPRRIHCEIQALADVGERQRAQTP
ncbi:hypothetical protein ElyMa_005958000 [Elysia marginata]|uniref:Uncharacterized protein n=1 Tax=Elysia marginata TaxID=1093978 RepID=A0AAV4GE44_9GAST|nr:hypothetical protein ElyMa_005958000 [Elysia marginata]